jgi:ElaB/YqjD/DUF883 family membrane-anchored ribosome-binding protein
MNTTIKELNDEATAVARAGANAADQMLRTTQRAVQQGMDHMGADLASARAHGTTAVKQFISGTGELATHGMDVVRDGALQVRDKTEHLRAATTTYIQHEPVKSVLMAAAAGAALMGLIALFSRSGGVRH